MKNLTEIEQIITQYLQKDIEFVLENKTIKSGKLILFSVKSFYLTFTLQINNKLVIFELPYPFDFSPYNNCIRMSYQTKELFANNIDAQCRNLLYTSKKNHKFLNDAVILKEKI